MIRSDAEEAVTLRLGAKGPGSVTAGDIDCPADVSILNGDLHLATLNGKARLAIDLTVERGNGYASSQREVETR